MGLFDKMKSDHNNRKEKTVHKVIDKHLYDGEKVEMWIRSAESVGTIISKVLVATDQRVILVERDANQLIPKENVQSFNYSNIESVNASSGALSNIQILAGVNAIDLKKVANKDVKPFIEYVNKKRNELNSVDTTSLVTSNQASEKSVAEKLIEFKELLDMDILTQEEFDKKKAELLN